MAEEAVINFSPGSCGRGALFGSGLAGRQQRNDPAGHVRLHALLTVDDGLCHVPQALPGGKGHRTMKTPSLKRFTRTDHFRILRIIFYLSSRQASPTAVSHEVHPDCDRLLFPDRRASRYDLLIRLLSVLQRHRRWLLMRAFFRQAMCRPP